MLTTAEPPAQLLEQDSPPTNLASALKQALNLKLPVWRGHAGPAAVDSAVMDYITLDDEVAAQVHRLSLLVGMALAGHESSHSASEHNTPFMVHNVLDEPLVMAAEALGLPIRLGRNQQQDTSETTGEPTMM